MTPKSFGVCLKKRRTVLKSSLLGCYKDAKNASKYGVGCTVIQTLWLLPAAESYCVLYAELYEASRTQVSLSSAHFYFLVISRLSAKILLSNTLPVRTLAKAQYLSIACYYANTQHDLGKDLDTLRLTPLSL